MAAFDNFPIIIYPITDENGVTTMTTLTDITTRILSRMSSDQIAAMTQNYTIQVGDTPESVSLKIYGTQDYYWVIMWVNNIFDYAADWYMNQDVLLAYCQSKYGDQWDQPAYVVDKDWNVLYIRSPDLDNYYTQMNNADLDNPPFLNFSQAEDGTVTYTDTSGLTATITWQEYEDELNNRKQTIKVIKPALLSNFLSIYNQQLTTTIA